MAGRKKIAILGGGVGAITAAFELTEQPDWANRYDITVYQMGWRLGGKGASGRNRKMGDRIEEHGLHLWFGYYHNAFNMMRRCYEQLGRAPGTPLATIDEAFKPHRLFILQQFEEGRWHPWRVELPDFPGQPGQGNPFNRFELLRRLAEWLKVKLAHDALSGLSPMLIEPVRIWLDTVIGIFDALSTDPENNAALVALETVTGGANSGGIIGNVLGNITEMFTAPVDKMIEMLPTALTATNIGQMIALGAYILKGILADKLLIRGFDHVDHLDMREWLASHGAGQGVTDSEIMRVSYESAFAFSKGSYHLPDVAAGTGIQNFLNLGFGYRGAFAWKMQAGMGDAIFAPLYQLLRARGVKFAFFHKVQELIPAADGQSIAQIRMTRQADLISGDPFSYDPLYDVKGLACWPSEPLYDQLLTGDVLAQSQVNFESHWSNAAPVDELTLNMGSEFDDIILGISLGALPAVAPQLITQKPQWRNMVDKVETIQTQAFQMWMRREGDPDQPVYGAFAQPHNTIADMSYLVDRENWPAQNKPSAIYYFCGPKSQHKPLPGPEVHDFPATATLAAGVRASQWLRTNFQFIDPNTMHKGGVPGSFPVAFDYAQLYVPEGSEAGTAPFAAQFWRANIDPSERYVLSTK